MPCIIYTPTPRSVTTDDDYIIYSSVSELMSYNSSSREAWNNGKAGLDELGKGGVLYLVGHGNAGSAIGAHGKGMTPVNEKELLAQLLEEGLPLTPSAPLTIHAYCCCSATKVRQDYRGALQTPFAERFGKLLADAKADNITLIGYAGFLKKKTHTMHYVCHDEAKIEWQNSSGASMTWQIDGGVITKMGTNEWEQSVQSNFHLFRKNSVYFDIKPSK
ncbi:hypothetical protein V8J88_09305 [Massilia sp. W12]|uniref:hypothetical protein n=1 Tax=Massilia sp. W12 TaxID=3126507 RepID=UPI0030D236D9